MTEHQAQCLDYINTRQSDYAFRCRRFDTVIDKMLKLFGGHVPGKLDVLDIGCGNMDFHKRLKEFFEPDTNGIGSEVEYVGIDGAIDGTDLNFWEAGHRAKWHMFVTGIEIVEHIYRPLDLLEEMERAAALGVVITTPNSRAVDVIGCDPTHVSIVTEEQLRWLGYEVSREELFGTPEDTLVAWKRTRRW